MVWLLPFRDRDQQYDRNLLINSVLWRIAQFILAVSLSTSCGLPRRLQGGNQPSIIRAKDMVVHGWFGRIEGLPLA